MICFTQHPHSRLPLYNSPVTADTQMALCAWERHVLSDHSRWGTQSWLCQKRVAGTGGEQNWRSWGIPQRKYQRCECHVWCLAKHLISPEISQVHPRVPEAWRKNRGNRFWWIFQKKTHHHHAHTPGSYNDICCHESAFGTYHSSTAGAWQLLAIQTLRLSLRLSGWPSPKGLCQGHWSWLQNQTNAPQSGWQKCRSHWRPWVASLRLYAVPGCQCIAVNS